MEYELPENLKYEDDGTMEKYARLFMYFMLGIICGTIIAGVIKII